MNERWLQEEMADIDRFIDECYTNDIVWEEEVGPRLRLIHLLVSLHSSGKVESSILIHMKQQKIGSN